MTQLYSIRSAEGEAQYTIMKFDRDLNLESVYALSASSCACPQGARGKPCRHRKLLPEFIQTGHINDGWFLDWDTRLWREPPADAGLASAASPLDLAQIVQAASEMLVQPNKFNPFNDPKAQEASQAEALGPFCVSAEAISPAAAESPPAEVQVAASLAGGSFKRRRIV